MTGQATADVGRASGAPAARAGVVYALAAFGWWGLVPIYFKAVSGVPALEVLAHRVVWSVLLLAIWMRVKGRWRVAAASLRSRLNAITLLATAVLIAANWLVFIWAVANDYVLQASLGYFINPLVNVFLGFVFLGERLGRCQWLAVALATAGVVCLTAVCGAFPLIALMLAGTFGFYGLLRKTARVDALVGLTVETTILLPAAVLYMAYLVLHQELVFASGPLGMSLTLAAAGPVTALPLLWFTNAARRLRLATLGFLQYLAPTGHFLLAVLLYREPFTPGHAASFALIWIALAIYTADTLRRSRSSNTF